jgi:hypothetical protein
VVEAVTGNHRMRRAPRRRPIAPATYSGFLQRAPKVGTLGHRTRQRLGSRAWRWPVTGARASEHDTARRRPTIHGWIERLRLCRCATPSACSYTTIVAHRPNGRLPGIARRAREVGCLGGGAVAKVQVHVRRERKLRPSGAHRNERDAAVKCGGLVESGMRGTHGRGGDSDIGTNSRA